MAAVRIVGLREIQNFDRFPDIFDFLDIENLYSSTSVGSTKTTQENKYMITYQN